MHECACVHAQRDKCDGNRQKESSWLDFNLNVSGEQFCRADMLLLHIHKVTRLGGISPAVTVTTFLLSTGHCFSATGSVGGEVLQKVQSGT